MPTDEIKESQPMTYDPTAMRSDSEQRPLTFGEKAVGLTFNVGNDPAVHQSKVTMAAAIDQMNDFRNSEGASQEHKRLASIAITELQGAQMFMVKAITWRD